MFGDTVYSYPEATSRLLKRLSETSDYILMLAPDAPLNLTYIGQTESYNCFRYRKCEIVVPTIDFFDFFDQYKKKSYANLFDAVIALRVLEHIEVRRIDWFVYQLASIMKSGARLVIVVPNMWEIAKQIRELEQGDFDWFKFCRLNYEILSEGNHVYDRHAVWTDELSIKRILTQEGLFEVDITEECYIDTKLPELYVEATRT